MLRARLYGYLIACCIGTIGLSAVFIMRKEDLPGNFYLYFIFPLLFFLPGIYLAATLYRTRSRNPSSHESLRSTGVRINALVTGARDIPGAGGFFCYTVVDPANPSKEYVSEPVAGTAEIIELTIASSDSISRAADFTLPLYISPTDPSVYFIDVKQADFSTPSL